MDVQPGNSPPLVVVMGVSGSGKSTLGQRLARALDVAYLEGDDLHGPQNVARMAAGIALTDADRQQWLERLSTHLAQALAANTGLVVACSALKRSYRDILRRGAPRLRLVYLRGAPELLAQRTAARSGHFMPASLLDSQLATLQPPEADEQAVVLDIAQNPQTLERQALDALRTVSSATTSTATTSYATMPTFTKTTLFTDTDGRARFRDEPLPLSEGTPQAMLSPLAPSGGYQLRESPVGYRSQFHCTVTPQWVFILRGRMEVGLQDGSTRVFGPGEHFYSDDRLPAGAQFDPAVHGHWSRQDGPEPLATLFVRG